MAEQTTGSAGFGHSVASNLQSAVDAKPPSTGTGATVTVSADAVAPSQGTATGSNGEAIESNTLSASFALSLAQPTDSTQLRTLANDTTFHSNQRSAIAQSLGVDASTVAISSVTVDANGNLQVSYQVVY